MKIIRKSQKNDGRIHELSTKKKYTIRWKLDSTKYSFIDFKGYEAGKNQVKFLVNRDFSMTETNLLPEK
jgi:hypothetical protein